MTSSHAVTDVYPCRLAPQVQAAKKARDGAAKQVKELEQDVASLQAAAAAAAREHGDAMASLTQELATTKAALAAAQRSATTAARELAEAKQALMSAEARATAAESAANDRVDAVRRAMASQEDGYKAQLQAVQSQVSLARRWHTHGPPTTPPRPHSPPLPTSVGRVAFACVRSTGRESDGGVPGAGAGLRQRHHDGAPAARGAGTGAQGLGRGTGRAWRCDGRSGRHCGRVDVRGERWLQPCRRLCWRVLRGRTMATTTTAQPVTRARSTRHTHARSGRGPAHTPAPRARPCAGCRAPCGVGAQARVGAAATPGRGEGVCVGLTVAAASRRRRGAPPATPCGRAAA